MKIKRLLPVSLVLALCIFSSCSKDTDEINPSLDNTISADAKPQNPGPTQATLSISFNPNPVYVNENAVVTATIAPKPGEGELWLQKGVDDMGNHTTAALAVDWVTVAKTDVSTSDNASYNFISTTAGMYGFRAKYVPKGGSGVLAKDVTSDIQVIRNCTGITLNGAIISSSNVGKMYTFTVAYTVDSCMDLYGAKLQGGLTSFTSNVSTNQDSGNNASMKMLGNSNYIITWLVGDITNGFQNKYYVTFSKELKDAGEHNILDTWSIEGQDVNTNPVKVEFAPINFTVQ
ncbi:hypothetical protein [Pontibacter cellulosilyticus]|uniref:Uncharacterized protein n=1 Tax=Pontibacter cellulosilyticus TaxID=1720253 RepID=A0A923N8B7_9BACT|nr:hypothetical protein [Pontibacter cellulosilyticus]MBC5994648.1 hypothetical protein [Pontibacter cellulosilyticus]